MHQFFLYQVFVYKCTNTKSNSISPKKTLKTIQILFFSFLLKILTIQTRKTTLIESFIQKQKKTPLIERKINTN